MTQWTSQTLLISIGHFTPKQSTSSFSQVHTEPSPEQITSWAINLVLKNSKKVEIIPVIFSDHSAVRLDPNYRKKIIKNSNIWRLNNTLLNNQQIIEEIKKEIKICREVTENENTTTQNLWDTVKAVLRGRFIALQAYHKKQ